MNEIALGLLQYRIGQGRNSKQIDKKRACGIREKSHSCHSRQIPLLEPAETLQVGYDLVVMNRFMEMD